MPIDPSIALNYKPANSDPTALLSSLLNVGKQQADLQTSQANAQVAQGTVQSKISHATSDASSAATKALHDNLGFKQEQLSAIQQQAGGLLTNPGVMALSDPAVLADPVKKAAAQAQAIQGIGEYSTSLDQLPLDAGQKAFVVGNLTKLVTDNPSMLSRVISQKVVANTPSAAQGTSSAPSLYQTGDSQTTNTNNANPLYAGGTTSPVQSVQQQLSPSALRVGAGGQQQFVGVQPHQAPGPVNAGLTPEEQARQASLGSGLGSGQAHQVVSQAQRTQQASMLSQGLSELAAAAGKPYFGGSKFDQMRYGYLKQTNSDDPMLANTSDIYELGSKVAGLGTPAGADPHTLAAYEHNIAVLGHPDQFTPSQYRSAIQKLQALVPKISNPEVPAIRAPQAVGGQSQPAPVNPSLQAYQAKRADALHRGDQTMVNSLDARAKALNLIK